MMPLDQENAELLRSVVQPPRHGRSFAELAAGITKWSATIEVARYHGVLPLLYSRMIANSLAVPPDALALAKDEFERNAFHCMANAAELLDVLREFTNSEIAAMPFKGVVLGASAYGDMTARMAGDLDILIHHRDLPRSTQILKERGYELETELSENGLPQTPNYFEYRFVRPAHGMVVELRWRLELTKSFRRDLGMDWVWPRRRTVNLAGADVPNLDPVSALLILCMHGSKHGWTRLIWISDVAKLVDSEPQLDWDFAVREAKRIGLWRSLALGLILARRGASAAVPVEILRKVEGDRNVRELADFLYEHVSNGPGEMPGGLLPYNVKLLSFKDRLCAMASPNFFRPNERDRAVVRLPRLLEPLYYVIRPIRLLRDRAGR